MWRVVGDVLRVTCAVLRVASHAVVRTNMLCAFKLHKPREPAHTLERKRRKGRGVGAAVKCKEQEQEQELGNMPAAAQGRCTR